MEKTLVRARYIIGYEQGSHKVYENAEMLYEGDRVTAIGYGLEGAGQMRDHGNAIISPGFVDLNALGDIDHAQLDTEQTSPQKLLWSREYFENRRREAMTPEEEAFKSLYAYAQLLSRGVTTAMPITSVYYKKCGETYEEIEAAAENARKLGLRVYLGPGYACGQHVYDYAAKRQTVLFCEQEGLEGLGNAKCFAQKHQRAGGLVTPAMAPERLELQTEAVLLESKRFAKENGLVFRLHAAQSSFEYDRIWTRYRMSPVQYLDSLGLLDELTILPHALFTSGHGRLADQGDEDLEILGERGVSVVHCPMVYPRFGTALESFGRFIRYGVNVCLGTDTFPPDMFEAIRQGHAVAMALDGGRPENYYKRFYEAATLKPAKALGRKDLGRLRPGSKADYFVMSLDDFDLGVTDDDPIKTLCMNGHACNITTVVTDGVPRMEHRRLVGFDYEAAKVKAAAYYRRMKDSFPERSDYAGQPFFQTSYEIVKRPETP